MALRERAGLTQEECARHAGIGRSTYIEIERGRSRPRRDTVTRLARVLDVDETIIRAATRPLAVVRSPGCVTVTPDALLLDYADDQGRPRTSPVRDAAALRAWCVVEPGTTVGDLLRGVDAAPLLRDAVAAYSGVPDMRVLRAAIARPVAVPGHAFLVYRHLSVKDWAFADPRLRTIWDEADGVVAGPHGAQADPDALSLAELAGLRLVLQPIGTCILSAPPTPAYPGFGAPTRDVRAWNRYSFLEVVDAVYFVLSTHPDVDRSA
jgi:transcriptional regulator with XRE-family HTH domain